MTSQSQTAHLKREKRESNGGLMVSTGISPEQAVPMDEIATGIRGLRIVFVNVFGISNPDGSWALIDAGLPFSANLIHSWSTKHFEIPPQCIVLTHGHFDHVGGAVDLAELWGVPVYAHKLEAPYLTGDRSYPPPDTDAGGGLMTMLSPIYPRSPIDLGDRLRLLDCSKTAQIKELPDWTLLHTPGHTPGHCSLFRELDHALIVGDAFCTTKPESFFEAAIAQSPELHGPPAYFTSDWGRAQQSIRKLAQLHPEIIAPGHGRPLVGEEVNRKISQFAELFTEPADIPSGSR